MQDDYSLITPMKERRIEMRAIERGWPISDEQRTGIVEQLLLIAAGQVGDASARDRIRAVECLAKLDALNIQREQADKSSRMDVSILPPAYTQMTEQANSEMIRYLQSAALPQEQAPNADEADIAP